MPLDEIILYIVGFLSLYTQVFFLLTFFTEREKIREHEEDLVLHHPKSITFLVPCWNEEKTVVATVNSLLAIDYPADQFYIFIINDGSSDKTLDVLKSNFSTNSRIRIFDKQNGGKHSALNFALSEVTTELMATIDADTFIEPSGIKKAVAFFEENPKLSAVGGSVLIKNPKSIAQKAQSVEYQMFSFSKKILGLLGGVLVVPGAFSVFKTEAVRAIGGYGTGHGLEDLELTYRLQAKGYIVDHCHTAFAYTNGPDSIKSLFKQRLRWGYGFVNNTYDYRKAVMNRKFGNFGMFTLPTSILSYFIILAIFFISWVNIFGILFEKYTIVRLVGFGQFFQSFGVNWFFVNTKAIALLSVLMFSGLLLFVYLGRKMSKVDDRKYGSFFWFFFLYSMVVPFWILKTLYNTIFSRKPSWR